MPPTDHHLPTTDWPLLAVCPPAWPWSVTLHAVDCLCQTGPTKPRACSAVLTPIQGSTGTALTPRSHAYRKALRLPRPPTAHNQLHQHHQARHLMKNPIFILTSSSCWKKTWIKHVWRGLFPLLTGLKTTAPERRETVSHAEVVEPTKLHANHPNCSEERNDQPAQALPPGRRLGLSARHCDSCCRQRPCRQTAQSDQRQTPGLSSAMEVTTKILMKTFTYISLKIK